MNTNPLALLNRRNTMLLAAISGLLMLWLARPAQAEEPSWPSSGPTSQPETEVKPRGVTQAEAEECLRSLALNRSLDQIRRRALRYAMVSPRKVASALRSARLRGLYPTVHLLGMYRNDSAAGETQMKDMIYQSRYTSGDWPYKEQVLSDMDGHRLYAGFMLRFDLGTLAGGSESLKALEASRLRTEVIEKVNALYFKRKRLAIRYCTQTLPLGERLQLKSRVDEMEAALEGLAGTTRKGQGSVSVPAWSRSD